MKLVNDEKTIRAIAAMLLDMQERENTNLPLLTEQLKETQRGIDNLLNAIQQGIFTKSTKGRLEELEAAKEELGREMFANIIALGAIVGLTGTVSRDSLVAAVLARVPKGTEDKNRKAIDIGFQLAKEAQ